MELSERRAKILALIVEDYVGSAAPVGSQALVKRHGLNLSSATIRNEMAALEDEGLISHPHTSAGRIPSHHGYRFYVRSLMDERKLSPQERFTILHQFHQSARELEGWLGLAASVLSNALHSVALATQPRISDVRLKHLQLVELTEERALLVVVTADAAVHQQTVEFGAPVRQDTLTVLTNRLNSILAGKSAGEMFSTVDPETASDHELTVINTVVTMLRREDERATDVPVVEGVRELLRQPEFENSDRILDTLEAVDGRQLRTALPHLIENGVAVVIGDENSGDAYQDMSFVLTRYGLPGGASGLIGVMGPTRLAYSDAVAHVRYVGDVLTELMAGFYGEE